MSKILVCQHVAFEPLGTLNPLIKQNGLRIRYVNFGRDPKLKVDVEGYKGLVVLGGPMNVDEIDLYPHLGHEIELIKQAIDKNLPVLGICLGAQLTAKALGAEVKRNCMKEIGWHDLTLSEAGRSDPVIGHFKPREKIFQWHGDTFDIPEGAVHLASSPHCSNQAFRYKDRVYGLQFHLEADNALVERWLTLPNHLQDLAEAPEQTGPDQVRHENQIYMPRLNELSSKAFGQFIKLFGEKKKRLCLSSR